MSLSIGIVGLPNVGKSTLFNALTERSVPAENYPFCTIDPSVGVVAVPDLRLKALANFSRSEKEIPAAVEFIDIAGLVKGAAEGEGLGNKFLSHIREVDAIAEVVRVFKDPNVVHVHGEIDPLHDIDVINLELALSDMQTVTRARASLLKEIKSGDKEAIRTDGVLIKVENVLEEGKGARSASLSDEERMAIKSFGLISLKPILYVLNVTGADKKDIPENLMTFLNNENAKWAAIDASLEMDIMSSPEEERASLREDLGVSERGLDLLIKKSYELLGLMTFFTTGTDETRGWTIPVGSTAPRAGAAIHSDFEDKFIRADVIGWRDLLDAGSYATAREKGLIRTEGKEYIVKDGDVIEFRI